MKKNGWLSLKKGGRNLGIWELLSKKTQMIEAQERPEGLVSRRWEQPGSVVSSKLVGGVGGGCW